MWAADAKKGKCEGNIWTEYVKGSMQMEWNMWSEYVEGTCEGNM